MTFERSLSQEAPPTLITRVLAATDAMIAQQVLAQTLPVPEVLLTMLALDRRRLTADLDVIEIRLAHRVLLATLSARVLWLTDAVHAVHVLVERVKLVQHSAAHAARERAAVRPAHTQHGSIRVVVTWCLVVDSCQSKTTQHDSMTMCAMCIQ